MSMQAQVPKAEPSACCGGPAPAGVSACCVKDAEAKASGQSGCGCGSSPKASPAPSACCGSVSPSK